MSGDRLIIGADEPEVALRRAMDDLADAFRRGGHPGIVGHARRALDAYNYAEETAEGNKALDEALANKWTIPDEDAALLLRIASAVMDHPSTAPWVSALTTKTYALLLEARDARRAREARSFDVLGSPA